MGGGHLGERGQQLAHGPAMPGGVVSGPRRHHALEQGIDVHGQEQADGRLGRADPGEVVAHHRIGGSSVRPGVRGQPGRPTGPGRPDGLGSGDQGDRQRTGGDGAGGPVDQPLRGVAADGGHLAGGGVGPDPCGQLGGRGRPGAGQDVAPPTPGRSCRGGPGQRRGPLRPPGPSDRRASPVRCARWTGPTATTTGSAFGVVGGGVHRMGRVDLPGSGGKLPSPSVRHRPDRVSGWTPDGTLRTGADVDERTGKVGTLSSIGQPPTSDGTGRSADPTHPLPLRGGHGRLPGRGRVQRSRSAGQQLAGLGAGRPGRAVGRTPSASGTGPRRPSTVPPAWAATASG